MKKIYTPHNKSFKVRLTYWMTTIIMAIASFNASSHYTIHSTSKGVIIESASGKTEAKTGTRLKATDMVVIPAGGKLEVYNDIDKNIYTSVSDGRISVTRLMIDARKRASDNRGNVAAQLRFAKQQDAGSQRLYVEKGMVRRSLEVYDPEGQKIAADPEVIARYIASRISLGSKIEGDSLPAKTVAGRPAAGGLSFKVENTCDFPIYLNILKISKRDNDLKVGISEVGQPAGVYVLLPGQTLSREHFRDVPDTDNHLMVMAHCQFDIDEIIEHLGARINNIEESHDSTGNLPIYLLSI